MRFAAWLIVLALCAPAAQPVWAGPAPPIRVLSVDLAPRIDESARFRERFAVDLAHGATTSDDGEWLRGASVSEWNYSVRIPGAVSMSFHASRLRLTTSATLAVEGGGKRIVYRAGDIVQGGLWSHIFRGDTLSFHLLVNASEADTVALEIASLQAGYRGLGGGVPDHPRFKRALAAAATSAATCIENFECHKDAAKEGPGNGTAAILIGNIAQCTGTLINNTRADAAPLFLTARHCQSGVSNPAAGVAIYWHAITPCGLVMGSIYDALDGIQLGGETMVEQQDTWLIKLDLPFRTPDVYFAGWDATGGTFVGGYSIHHAMGRDKQYAEWFGQAVSVPLPGSAIDVNYESTYWGVMNSLGSIGAGASGGALFDPDNRVVGVASLAYLQEGEGSDGFCPLTPTPAPTADNATALYNALSEVWDSTADTTSSTNPVTFKTILDPDGTGQRVLDGFAYQSGATLFPSNTFMFTSEPVQLTWNAPGASSCTASGGTAGDGWAGVRPANGTVEITQYVGGNTRYLIRCPTGNRVAVASTLITWSEQAPGVFIGTDLNSPFAGETFKLFWHATVTPCVASGGIAGDGWAGSQPTRGQMIITASQIGQFTYTLACGTGTRTASTSFAIEVRPPVAFLTSDASGLRIVQPVNLFWGGVLPCTASGGTPGDGWIGTLTSPPSFRTVTETAPGSYTYTLTCGHSPFAANASVTVTFTNGAPAVTLTANPASQEVPLPVPIPPGYPFSPNLHWTSNVRPCALTYSGPGATPGTVRLEGDFPAGTALDLRDSAGLYTYTLACGSGATAAQATATIDWYATQPYLNFFGTSELVANLGFLFNWNSNVFPCTGTGGAAGDGWAGPKTTAWGSQGISESAPGTYAYVLSCGSGAQIVQRQIVATVADPAVTLTASRTSGLHPTEVVALDWSATTSPCVASSNPVNSRWTGPQQYRGGAGVTETAPGTYTYTITCGIAPLIAQSSVQVTFDAIPQRTAALSASVASATINQPVTLTWNSTNASSCVSFSQPFASDWDSLPNLGPSGTATVTRFSVGTVLYGVDCEGASARVSVDYGPVSTGGDSTPRPVVTLDPNVSILTVGQQLMLTWNSQNSAECTASGGANGDGWVGSLPLAGKQFVTEPAAGFYTYGITCTGAPPAASAFVMINFTNEPPPPSGGGGGGGGGGAVDPMWLLLYASATLRVLLRARRVSSIAFARRPGSLVISSALADAAGSNCPLSPGTRPSGRPGSGSRRS